MRTLIAAALIGLGAAACAPPPPPPLVQYPCGPDLPTHAEDDACVTWTAFGTIYIGPLSKVPPGVPWRSLVAPIVPPTL